MQKVRVAIIGAGNISNTRHIPALKKIKEAEIFGVLSNKVEKSQRTAEKHGIKNFGVVGDDIATNIESLKQLSWFDNVDAVVIGAPPHLHYGLVKMSLELEKHVLVEKPMMMNEAECNELIGLAEQKGKIFYVMHNFQYAGKMLKLNEVIKSKIHGEITSITEVQFTNHDRRLPEWYNDLPLGLFYDEAAHFMYLLERHAGQLTIDDAHVVRDTDPQAQTPRTLTVNATAGNVPVTMMLDFHAPICEWHYIVNFQKRIYIYDFFKDILITLPTDNEHLAKDVLRNSVLYTWQFWTQFLMNGIRMVTGNLLYGHDTVLRSFVRSVNGDPVDEKLTAKNGRTNVISINEIVKKTDGREVK